MRMGSIRAWVVTLWCVFLMVAAVASALLERDAAAAVFLIPVALTITVGALLVIKVPHNRIGIVALVGGSAWMVYVSSSAYARASAAAASGPFVGEYLAAWLGAWTGALFFVALTTIVSIFPNGKPTRFSRWLLILMGILVGMLGVGAVMLWGIPAEMLVDYQALDEVNAYLPVDATYLVGLFALAPAAFSLLLRYRSSPAMERQQIKWLLIAVMILVATLFARDPFILRRSELLAEIVLAVALSLLPLAIAVAVLRYRLYDIDRILSRTVAYILIVGLLGAIFFGIVAGVGARLGTENQLVVAGATLAVAALFNPLRKRIQRWVDRRFNRSRYDTQKVMDRFSLSLREQTDPETVIDGWVGVVAETMEPSSVGVWVRD